MVRVQDSSATDDRLLDELTTVVSAAGAAILATRSGSLDTRTKSDLTPGTVCDHSAEAVVLEGLARLLPGMGIWWRRLRAARCRSVFPIASFWSTPSTVHGNSSP